MQIVVGLGANLGERLQTLRAAMRLISRVAQVEKGSRVYSTRPVGGPLQPDFLNAAALLTTTIPPLAFLEELLGIEQRLGRVRTERWGPRTIDLDILWTDGPAIDTPRLTVPHPELRARAFALAPMLELVPDARDPRTGEQYAVPQGDIRLTNETLDSVLL